jgi:hypothetical protein
MESQVAQKGYKATTGELLAKGVRVRIVRLKSDENVRF